MTDDSQTRIHKLYTLSHQHYVADIVIAKENGLHLRPAAEIAQIAQNVSCEIQIVNDHCSADGKSVLELVSLLAENGSNLTIEVKGSGAREVLDQIVQVLTDEEPKAEGPSPRHPLNTSVTQNL